MKEMIMEIMQPAVATVATALMAAAGLYIRSKIKSATALRVYDEVVHSLKAGMAVAQDDVVRPFKAKKPKLDPDTIKMAEETALAVAKDVATGKAAKMLEEMKGSEVKSLIKTIKASLK